MSSTTTQTTSLNHTAFHQFHVDHGAKMVDFAGWHMPLHYGSIIEEHHQVRESGGLFDVSHMGRLRFVGKDACRFLDRICTRQIHGMNDSQVRYTLFCNEQGGCKDDGLIYKRADGDYLMVCNAANREKLLEHIERVKGEMVFKLSDQTMKTAMVAIQGPNVMQILAEFTRSVSELKRFRFIEKNLLVAQVMISRTGYTGEDGVEVILPNMIAKQAVQMMLKKVPGGIDAEDAPIKPCGLGARDSLRLEAGMPLFGHEIDEDIDPLTAGLDFAVKLTKGDDDPEVERFIGQDALKRIAEEGPKRRLVGLVLEGKRAARQGMVVKAGDSEVGKVASGCFSPTLQKSIATAHVLNECSEKDTELAIALGRNEVPAKVVPLPFYKPASA